MLWCLVLANTFPLVSFFEPFLVCAMRTRQFSIKIHLAEQKQKTTNKPCRNKIKTKLFVQKKAHKHRNYVEMRKNCLNKAETKTPMLNVVLM